MTRHRLVLRFFRLFVVSMIGFLTLSIAQAQLINVADNTSTPIPGAGHDYIRLLSETVNLANGSLSLRIAVPMPKGRGITIPFYFGYDSNAISHLESTPIAGQSEWRSDPTYLSQGGWKYAVPMASNTFSSYTLPFSTKITTCYVYAGYMFTDASGGQHALNLGSAPLIGGGGPCPTVG